MMSSTEVVAGGMSSYDERFPCSLDLDIPFPTRRLAEIALRTLSVDEELSPLVNRSLDLSKDGTASSDRTSLVVHYKATTNRMLRVSVNSFFDSLGLIAQVMEELDEDVIHEKGFEDLAGVQGVVEQGLTGETIAGA